jgi:hypothetical protein
MYGVSWISEDLKGASHAGEDGEAAEVSAQGPLRSSPARKGPAPLLRPGGPTAGPPARRPVAQPPPPILQPPGCFQQRRQPPLAPAWTHTFLSPMPPRSTSAPWSRTCCLPARSCPSSAPSSESRATRCWEQNGRHQGQHALPSTWCAEFHARSPPSPRFNNLTSDSFSFRLEYNTSSPHGLPPGHVGGPLIAEYDVSGIKDAVTRWGGPALAPASVSAPCRCRHTPAGREGNSRAPQWGFDRPRAAACSCLSHV